MDAVDLGVNLFVALFALVDPIGNIPIFAAATAGASARQRMQVTGLLCLFIVGFLVVFFFTGLTLLDKGHLGELGTSHIVARQEMRALLAGLNLPETGMAVNDGLIAGSGSLSDKKAAAA